MYGIDTTVKSVAAFLLLILFKNQNTHSIDIKVLVEHSSSWLWTRLSGFHWNQGLECLC